MAIKLVIEALAKEPITTSQYELDQSVITVGRSKSCHIELDCPRISRRHFIIKFDDGRYYLADEGSRHGTIVDGQHLMPEQNFFLQSEHVIEIPGFRITLYSDGQKPRLERTTVVARKLLDELLQDEVDPRECPRLLAKNGQLEFRFVEHKTSFVLGRHPHVDFIVDGEDVALEHVSFVRDINGVLINPLPEHQVLVDGIFITDPQLLNHNSEITVGGTEFIFKLSDDRDGAIDAKQPRMPILPDDHPGHTDISSEPTHEIETALKMPEPKVSPLFLKVLDTFFLMAFFLVVAWASAMFFSLV